MCGPCQAKKISVHAYALFESSFDFGVFESRVVENR